MEYEKILTVQDMLNYICYNNGEGDIYFGNKNKYVEDWMIENTIESLEYYGDKYSDVILKCKHLLNNIRTINVVVLEEDEL